MRKRIFSKGGILKTKSKMILTMVLSVAVMTTITGCNGKKENVNSSKEEKVTTGSAATTKPEEKAEDTEKKDRGEFKANAQLGKTYENDWLGVKIEFPGEYTQQLPLLNFKNADFGFYSKDESNENSFCCYYYDITNTPDMTEEELLEKARNYIIEKKGTYEKIENGSVDILDLKYICEHAKVSQDGKDVYVSTYMAKCENKIVVFNMMNNTGTIEDNKNLINCIKSK